MASRSCPRCGNDRLLPIAYGLPTADTMRAAQRGEVALGGCLLGGDDPRRRCASCEAGVYPDGVFADAASELGTPALGVVLPSPPGMVVEALIADGSLAIGHRPAAGPATRRVDEVVVPADEYPTVELMLLVQRFGGGDDPAPWLRRRRIPHSGTGFGALAGVAVGDHLVVRGTDGEVTVPLEAAARVVLGCLVDVFGDGTFAGPADFGRWLTDHGVEVHGAAV